MWKREERGQGKMAREKEDKVCERRRKRDKEREMASGKEEKGC